MWPRKRPDIGLSGLTAALADCGRSIFLRSKTVDIAEGWLPPHESVVALSARSAFDLLLQASDLPPGSEVLLSEVTIPHMEQIVRDHNLAPRALPISWERLSPSPAECERSINPRTRMAVVASLLGSRIDLGPFARVFRRHDVMLVEDAAQGFAGCDYGGSPSADVTLFSFGPIKAATALGGGVARVRRARIAARMRDLLATQPRQATVRYIQRVIKYTILRGASHPWAYGLLVGALDCVGYDLDRWVASTAKGFGAQDWLTEARRQPCIALQRTMRQRVQSFQPLHLRRRRNVGEYLHRRLFDAGVPIVGYQAQHRTHWVVAILANDSQEFVGIMRQAGFDATTQSSLAIVNRRVSQAHWLDYVVFLPDATSMPDREVERMVDLVIACRPTLPDVCRATDAKAPSRPRIEAATP